jgi:flagellar biosynthesis/type III secretory pathway chaperone
MSTDPGQRIEALLDAELALAEQLSDTLESERQALTGTVPEAVRKLAEAKVDLLLRLEQMERTRRELCPDSQIRAMPEAIRGRWHALLAAIKRCRAANEVNGYIINVRRNQVQQLIDVVRGTESLTYGPAGKTAAKALRELARA